MAGILITSLLSLATNLLPSIRASAQAASSSSSSNSNNSEKERARAVEEDLERLMRTLERINATLYDAEEREIRDRSVKLWLKELKMVAYDAEDVLGEYRYEVLRVQVEERRASQASASHKREQIEYIVSIPDGMVDRLKKIRSQFKEIAKDRKALQLRESDGVRRPNNKNLRPPTGHMVDEGSIFGRDDEIDEIIDFLLFEKEKEKSFSVISIVGKGGLGKTTIAQLVYKNERVSRCFDLLGWVCVSEEFDAMRLMKATIESVSKNNYSLNELSPLQEELAKTVKGKTILLVLDDVWNENQRLWELFQVPFKEAKLVRILVTTRNKKVADVMQTTTYFRPTNLPEDLCWQLFQHYAFSGTSDTMPKQLVDLGREIMRKCGGLPLAVKSIASLLRHETYEEGWREILESDLWESNSANDIFPALQISYAHLPPHLKPCFLFCSMYPKDYILQKKNLIELWISHGYIESRGKRRIEEIAGEYYEELLERSFLDELFGFYLDKRSARCKLHDIIHDLARLNSENEHYSLEINQPLNTRAGNVPRETYHLYASGFMGYVNQILQQNMKGLRTLSLYSRACGGDLDREYCINNTKFEALRVLDLKGDDLTRIPDSISELKHLTYLGITSSRLKMLPLSIGLLYNLQTLILYCDSLEYLPESIGDLLNLQFLKIKSRNLRNLPKSLGSLSNLLRLVIIGNNLLDYVPHGLVNFPAIKTMKARLRVGTVAWLKDMTDLEGTVSIYGVSNLVDAELANMRNKCKLETLYLSCKHKSCVLDNTEKSKLILSLTSEACEDGWVDVDDDFSWLEYLQPHPNLKKLQVRDYSSATVPGWMRDPFSLQSIQEVLLEGCYNIKSLPFNNLHTLKHLTISGCHSIRVLQLEQLPSQLEKLKIKGCDYLELITGLGNLYMLPTLMIYYCNVLKSITMDGLQLVESTEPIGDSSEENPHIGQQSISSLTRLRIQSLPFNNLHTLKHLIIFRCGSIRVLQLEQLPSQLEELKIIGCDQLVLITGLGNLDMLATLKIYFCRVLKSITMDGLQLVESTEPIGDSSKENPHIGQQSISSLTRLPIQSLHNIHTLKHLTIADCDSIRVLQLEQLPSQLEELHIERCHNLELITGLGNLNMLVTLKISCCGLVKSIIMNGLHLVESTEPIGDSFKENTDIGQQNISSLTKLIIHRCKLLCVLPDGLIPSGPCCVYFHGCGCPYLEIGHIDENLDDVFLRHKEHF